jgi:hypothetical protein
VKDEHYRIRAIPSAYLDPLLDAADRRIKGFMDFPNRSICSTVSGMSAPRFAFISKLR